MRGRVNVGGGTQSMEYVDFPSAMSNVEFQTINYSTNNLVAVDCKNKVIIRITTSTTYIYDFNGTLVNTFIHPFATRFKSAYFDGEYILYNMLVTEGGSTGAQQTLVYDLNFNLIAENIRNPNNTQIRCYLLSSNEFLNETATSLKFYDNNRNLIRTVNINNPGYGLPTLYSRHIKKSKNSLIVHSNNSYYEGYTAVFYPAPSYENGRLILFDELTIHNN